MDVYKTGSADQIEGGIGGNADIRTRLPLDSQGEGWQGAGSLQGVYTDLAEKTNPKASGIARKPFQVFSAIPQFYWVSGLLERTAGIAEALLEERRCLCFLYSATKMKTNSNKF